MMQSCLPRIGQDRLFNVPIDTPRFVVCPVTLPVIYYIYYTITYVMNKYELDGDLITALRWKYII